MSDHDRDEITLAVDAVWRQLAPALEQHYRTIAVPRRRRAHRFVGLGLAAVLVGTGGAVAARSLLEEPAPPDVQASIAGVDAGMPADLQLRPDVTNARSVARDGDAVLYAADLPDGGVCTELAVAGRPAGAVCVRGRAPAAPIDATIPGTPEDRDANVVIGGRVNVAADVAVVVIGGHEGPERLAVALAPGGYFVVALDAPRSRAARAGIAIEAVRGGTIAASVDLTDAFTPEPGPAESIGLELVSGDGDLTKVVSIHGTVNVTGATAVRLVYPDGTTQEVGLRDRGEYALVLPVERQADLARRPGRVLVVDAAGHELASRVVAAVSWWRAHQGG
jgi:hypothetical protein